MTAVMYTPSPFISLVGQPPMPFAHDATATAAAAPTGYYYFAQPAPQQHFTQAPQQPPQGTAYFMPMMMYPSGSSTPHMVPMQMPLQPQMYPTMTMMAGLHQQQQPFVAMPAVLPPPRAVSDDDSAGSVTGDGLLALPQHAQSQQSKRGAVGGVVTTSQSSRSIVGALRFSECRQKRPVVPPVAPAAPKGEREARQLVINYLASEITSQHLATLLSQFGHVEGCRVITDNVTNVSKGFAFVYMSTQEEAFNVIANASGRVLLSKRIKVAFADPQVPLGSFKSAAYAPYAPLSPTPQVEKRVPPEQPQQQLSATPQ